jgi:hypothetical protein
MGNQSIAGEITLTFIWIKSAAIDEHEESKGAPTTRQSET